MTRILMVEDHRYFSEAFALVLERGLAKRRRETVVTQLAETVREGLALVSEEGPFDLAIVDLMLPDGDGTEVIRVIKATSPQTPVVAFSSVEDLTYALEAGADESMHKSVALSKAIALVDGLLARGGRTAN